LKILHRDRPLFIALQGQASGVEDDILDFAAGKIGFAELVKVHIPRQRQFLRQELFPNLSPLFLARSLELDFQGDPPLQCLVERDFSIRRQNADAFKMLQLLE
jgi:hypothetical protein